MGVYEGKGTGNERKRTDNSFIALLSLRVPLSLQLGLDHIQRASCDARHQTTSCSGCRVVSEGEKE